MFKILILAYLIGSDPVITQQNFEMEGWYKTMQECQANLLKQHPDQTYEVMREFVTDTNFNPLDFESSVTTLYSGIMTTVGGPTFTRGCW